jgi:hypothetical protein
MGYKKEKVKEKGNRKQRQIDYIKGRFA